MGKIRVKTLGDETTEKAQVEKAKARREGKRALKTHVKGVGLKGGQQLKVMEGTELKPEVEKLLHEETRPEAAKKPKKVKVRHHSKRYQKLRSLVSKNTSYSIKDAIKLLKKTSNTRFDGTVEVHINLQPTILTKDKPSLSGNVKLPFGTGKKRIIKIVDEKLLTQLESGKIDFDALITEPQYMPKLAKFAKILGPRGLMPNPKNRTVTADPEKRAQELVQETAWKTEPDHPLIHQAIGKVSFIDSQIEENFTALIQSIGAGKIAKITLNSTMGPGIKIDLNSI